MTDDVPAGDGEVEAAPLTERLLLEWASDFAEAATHFKRLEKCVLLTRAQQCREAAASLASETERADNAVRERDAESRNAARYADDLMETRAAAAEANALKNMWNDRALAAEASLLACQAENAKLVGRYEWLRSWYLRGGRRSEIHELGHIQRTTSEIFDAGVDRARATLPKEAGRGG